MCRKNIAANACEPTISTCEQLWWGAGPELDRLSSRHQDGFDFIFGADCIYEKVDKGQLDALLETACRMLRKPTTPDPNATLPGGLPGAGGGGAGTGAEPSAAVFLLAFCRQLVPIDNVLDLARSKGLVPQLAEDRVYDMFGHNTDGMTDMWADCIYEFRWTPLPDPPPPATAIF